jgi:hypothetical protein
MLKGKVSHRQFCMGLQAWLPINSSNGALIRAMMGLNVETSAGLLPC